jgi:hypothetical protein
MMVALVITSWTQAQQVPPAQSDGGIGAWSAQELAQRIFTGEQMTIAQVSKRAPIVESYVQSLDPEAHPETVIDDAYFLGRVSLDGDSPRQERLQSLMVGARPESRFIRVNTGDRWPLYPDGYVDMLFVDITDFDKDHYQLTYKQTDTLGDKQWLAGLGSASRSEGKRARSGRHLGRQHEFPNCADNGDIFSKTARISQQVLECQWHLAAGVVLPLRKLATGSVRRCLVTFLHIFRRAENVECRPPHDQFPSAGT